MGNFNAPATSLAFNTITVNGDGGNETVNISQLSSDHRLVFNSGTGSDRVIGSVRPQDTINMSGRGPAGNAGSLDAIDGVWHGQGSLKARMGMYSLDDYSVRKSTPKASSSPTASITRCSSGPRRSAWRRTTNTMFRNTKTVRCIFMPPII